MADVKIEHEATLNREELADWLADLAEAVREGGAAELSLSGPVVTLALPDQIEVEVQVEIDGDEVELELELSWSTARGRKSGADDRAGGENESEGDDAATAGAAKGAVTGAAKGPVKGAAKGPAKGPVKTV